MRGLPARVGLSAVGLALPTVVVLLCGIYFLVNRVPAILRNEQRRVLAEYRLEALALKNHPETGVARPRGKGPGWAKDRKMAPGYWGVVTDADKTLVWYLGEGDVCVAREVTPIEEVDFRLIFWGGGTLVLMLLVGLTVFCVWHFFEYAKSRDDFLAAAAHDLTTPLVALRYMIGRDDAEAKNLNERMLRLVANLKDFLKLGGRRPPPRREEVDLIAAFDAAYRLFREDYRDLFEGKDVELVRPAEGAARALGDETLVVQILWNLLGNDLKYAAPYGKVWAELSATAEEVRLSLFDAGKGMTPHERRRAFDRYYRAKSVLESGKGGFGIGLSAAREAAVAMGGTLTLAANAPRGCVFTLGLPRAGGKTLGPRGERENEVL